MTERPSTTDVVINLIAFQCAWLALALSAAQGLAEFGIAAALAVIAIHLFRSPDATAEAKLLAAAFVIGIMIESAVMAGGFLAFEQSGMLSGPIGQMAPLWLLVLWPAFATLLNITFRAFRNWIVGAALFGAIFVPIAYFAGARLGAMILPDPQLLSLSVIGLAWAVALPALCIFARHCDGWQQS